VTLQEKLTQAETAYHELMTGQKAVVFVDQNGERIEYNRVSAARLQQYIADLKSQINGTPYGAPLRPFF